MAKRSKKPQVHPSVYVAPTASIIGDVTIGRASSVWYSAVIRGDIAPIRIGEESNIQDACVLHVGTKFPCTIGNRVTIGHGAVVHGATLEDEVLIGIGAIVLNGAVVGKGSLIGSGALVTEGARIPPASLVLGVPGKVVGPVDKQRRSTIIQSAEDYVQLSAKNKERGAE